MNGRWSYIAPVGHRVNLLHRHSPFMESAMLNRKLLLSVIVASTFATLAPLTQAAVEVYVNTPPPAVRYEAVPSSRAGHVWAPGYWNWRNNKYVWTKGRWERERAGYFYHPHRYAERDGRWFYERGRWDRNRPMGDRDRDGIPNARDRDRDGDGVPNRVDRKPNNPRQQ